MKALFICTGNSCRSVMAQYLFDRAASRRELRGWQARSCGIAAERYFPVPAGVRKALSDRNIPLADHVPQLVGRPILAWADCAFAMASNHYEALWDMFPEHRPKLRLFLEAAGLGRGDVDDPIGKSEAMYQDCCRLIERGIDALIQNHAKPAPQPRP